MADTQQISLRLSAEFLAELDRVCGKYGFSRSDVLDKALRVFDKYGFPRNWCQHGNPPSKGKTSVVSFYLQQNNYTKKPNDEAMRQLLWWYIHEYDRPKPQAPLEAESTAGLMTEAEYAAELARRAKELEVIT